MSFTDRYIKVPIKLFDKQIKELTGKYESEDSYLKINPFEIVKYRQSWDDGSEIVCVTDKLGDATLVYLTLNEFETLLNNHQK